MELKSLYDANFRETPEARVAYESIRDHMEAIIEPLTRQGYDPRHIQALLHNVATDVGLDQVFIRDQIVDQEKIMMQKYDRQTKTAN